MILWGEETGKGERGELEKKTFFNRHCSKWHFSIMFTQEFVFLSASSDRLMPMPKMLWELNPKGLDKLYIYNIYFIYIVY